MENRLCPRIWIIDNPCLLELWQASTPSHSAMIRGLKKRLETKRKMCLSRTSRCAAHGLRKGEDRHRVRTQLHCFTAQFHRGGSLETGGLIYIIKPSASRTRDSHVEHTIPLVDQQNSLLTILSRAA